MSKKMCPKNFHTSEKTGISPDFSLRSGVDEAKSYYPPVFRENKAGCYIELYAYNPETAQFQRKRIKINRVKGTTNRRKYAKDLIARITDQLKHGWNPWIARDTENLVTFEEGLSRYEAYVEKMHSEGYFRKETYAGYKSNIKILRLYIAKEQPIYYLYQFSRKFCSDFLDYIFIDRGNGAQTRNNYLNFLRVLSGYFVSKGLLQSKPTDGIAPISKRLITKERTCIPLDVVGKIGAWCRENDPHFLLACHLLYYCLVRPVEMTRLKVRHFNLRKGTLVLPGDITKNKTDSVVTVPKKVLHYAIGLGVFSANMDDYIFSDRLAPGRNGIDPKIFRDHWEKVRKALKLKKEWRFYSLKDTGITAMCKDKLAPVTVKDQARHSSLAITELYLGHDVDAVPELLDLDGAL